MRISAYDIDGRSELFLQADGAWAALGPLDLAELIRSGDEGRKLLAAAAARASASAALPAGARLLAPLPRPGKLVFVGVNYLDHVAELPRSGRSPPSRSSSPSSPARSAVMATRSSSLTPIARSTTRSSWRW